MEMERCLGQSKRFSLTVFNPRGRSAVTHDITQTEHRTPHRTDSKLPSSFQSLLTSTCCDRFNLDTFAHVVFAIRGTPAWWGSCVCSSYEAMPGETKSNQNWGSFTRPELLSTLSAAFSSLFWSKSNIIVLVQSHSLINHNQPFSSKSSPCGLVKLKCPQIVRLPGHNDTSLHIRQRL